MAETLLDVQALLAPVPGDARAGTDHQRTPLFDKINELRLNEDQGGAVDESVGRLREGQARVADWAKVSLLCQEALANKTKDLSLVTHLAESMTRQHGLGGLRESLDLAHGMLEQYWADAFPLIEDNDLEPRAMWLERLDRLSSKALNDLPLTVTVEGEAKVYWQWQHMQHLMEAASQAPADQRDAALAEAQEKKTALESAVGKTSREFYVTRLLDVKACRDKVDAFRTLVDDKFRAEPGIDQMDEPPPSFSDLRTILEQCQYRIEELLATKPGPPPGMEDEQEQGAGTVAMEGGRGTPGTSGPIQSRADALRRLQEVAAFFQRTEPHSPVAYLVQRAARWGEQSLDSWLAEVVGDEAVMARIRETLGIRSPDA